MLVSVFNKEIKKVLKGLKKLTKKSNHIGMDKHCLIETGSNSLIFKGYFNFTEIRTKIDAGIKTEGSVVVKISELDKICKKLKSNSSIRIKKFIDHNGKNYIEVSDGDISLYCSTTYEVSEYRKLEFDLLNT